MKKTTWLFCLACTLLLFLTSCAQTSVPELTEVEPGRFVDENGRLCRLEFTDAQHGDCYKLYTYDEAGREKTVATYQEDGTQVETMERFYDENGLRTYTEYTRESGGQKRLVLTVEYNENEEPIRLAFYHENGEIESEMVYELKENNQLSLTIRDYDDQGRLKRYHRGGDGEPEIEIQYNESGAVIYEERWTDQLKHTGEKTWYDEDGNRIKWEQYENNILIQKSEDQAS